MRRLIVHVVYRFAVGGLENGLVNLVNRLPRDAWRHAIVALRDIDPTFAARLRTQDVELLALGKPPGHGWALYPRLVSLLRKLEPAIVHTRNLAALEMTPAVWAAGVPARVHGEHGRDAVDPDGHSSRRRWIRRIYKPFVTRYVTVSPDLEVYLRDAIGVPRQRIDQIYNGVDCDVFAPSSARAAIAGCPFDPTRHRLIGTVGRMDPVKNHTGLVRVFARLAQNDPVLAQSLRLVIVGDGAERARIEAELLAAGIRDLAWLPGERQDIAAILRGLDVFVLPSSGEGVSNVILEAMATALPVVATNVGANAELVADGATGRIVAVDDGALVQAIRPYALDPALARAHGQAGRARVEQRFSLERMVEQYHRLYLGLVAGSSSSRPSADTFTPQVRR